MDFKIKSLRKISVIDYSEYQKFGTGKLIQRIDNGATAGKGILFDYYFTVIRQLVPSIIFIWSISKTITYIILAGYTVVFIVTNLLLKILYKFKENILCNEEKINHCLVRGFMEMVVFRISGTFKKEIEKTMSAKSELIEYKVKMNLIHEAFFTIFALLVTFIKIGIIIYGWKTKAISIGSIIALITLVDNAYTPVAIFNVLFVQYKLDKVAFNRFKSFLDSPEDKQLKDGHVITKLNGKISVENLSFSYSERNIFSKLNFEISSGEKVAIIGESGSGKSTIIKLLMGLLKQDKTVIFITHRLNSIRSFKHIIVFKGGDIVAEGNFDELMDKSDYFKILYSLGE